MSAQQSEAALLDAQGERARRAERLTQMFARWEAEDMSDEPDWDVEDIEPMRFRTPVLTPESDAHTS